MADHAVSDAYHGGRGHYAPPTARLRHPGPFPSAAHAAGDARPYDDGFDGSDLPTPVPHAAPVPHHQGSAMRGGVRAPGAREGPPAAHAWGADPDLAGRRDSDGGVTYGHAWAGDAGAHAGYGTGAGGWDQAAQFDGDAYARRGDGMPEAAVAAPPVPRRHVPVPTPHAAASAAGTAGLRVVGRAAHDHTPEQAWAASRADGGDDDDGHGHGRGESVSDARDADPAAEWAAHVSDMHANGEAGPGGRTVAPVQSRLMEPTAASRARDRRRVVSNRAAVAAAPDDEAVARLVQRAGDGVGTQRRRRQAQDARRNAARAKRGGARRQDSKKRWLRDNNALGRRAGMVEREIKDTVYNTRSDLKSDVAALAHEDEQLALRREQEWGRIRARLQKLRGDNTRLRRHVESMGTGPAYVRTLQRLVNRMESELTTFRASQRGVYQELMAAEGIASRDVAEAQATVERLLQEGRARLERRRRGGGDRDRRSSGRRGSSGGEASPRESPSAGDGGGKSAHGKRGGRVADLAAIPSHLAMPPIIAEIDAKIAADGGATGGWPDDEHRTFMLILKAYRDPRAEAQAGRGDGATPPRRDSWLSSDSDGSGSDDAGESPRAQSRRQGSKAKRDAAIRKQLALRVARGKMSAFLRRCELKLLGYSQNSIKDHYTWWLAYAERMTTKREAVREWRQRRAERMQEAASRLQAAPANGGDPGAGAGAAGDGGAVESPRTRQRRERREAAKRAKVEAWRAAKEAKARAEEQEQRAKEEAAERARRQRERERRTAVQAELERHKAEQERERERQRAAQAALAEQRQAREAQRQRRQGRDHVSLNERAEREVAAAAERYRAMEAAREEEERRAAAAAKARPMGHRDPSRLLQPTKAFESHVHAHDEDVKAGERRKAAGAHASVVPSAAGAAPGRGRSYTFGAQRAFRAMPSWRSGV